MWRLGHMFVLMYRGLILDCIQNIPPPDFKKPTELVSGSDKGEIETYYIWETKEWIDLFTSWCVWQNALCEQRLLWRKGRKNPAVSLNHLFKLFKQTWMVFIFFFSFFFLPSLWSTTEYSHEPASLSDWSSHFHGRTGANHSCAVTSSTGTTVCRVNICL